MHITRVLSQYHLAWRTLALAELGKSKETAAAVEALQQSYPEVTYEYFINNGWTSRVPKIRRKCSPPTARRVFACVPPRPS